MNLRSFGAAFVAVVAACAPIAHNRIAPAHRIVTLMPSFAEDVCALGGRSQLVGVSAYSQDVACARGLPEVNNFASIDTEKIVALHAGRAIAIPAQQNLAAALVRAGVTVTFLRDDSYGDIFNDLAQIGAVLGRPPSYAAKYIARLRAQTAALRRRAHYRRAPSVLFVEQAQPLWTVGRSSYIATLINIAGGRLATADLQSAYAQYSNEAVLRSDPDVIVATADARIDQVLGREPWRSLRAVRLHRVFVDPRSNDLVRPSPRYIDGLKWLIARFSSL